MREFQAESKRLMELMIHSIYTHKEIFLRELISNASDATDKRYFQQVQKGGEALNREDLPITLTADAEKRQLILEDCGIGMTADELEKNLGTIAQSGSLDFKNSMKEMDDPSAEAVDIIGQFGVGFYSAFMVADNVEVYSKPLEGDAHKWQSTGVEGYTLEPATKDEVGTRIVITLKEDTEDENYSEFVDPYRLQHLVKKYSDYIRYPIQMDVEHSQPVEGEEGEYETVVQRETLNSMTPIWKRQRGEVSDADYNQFYKEKFFDFADPLKTIYTRTEGAATYDALLFIPSQMPMNYHSKDYQKGLQLYASGVMIMEHCADLLPDHFGFVRGVVDSQDLSLNISREMLQHDRQLLFIAQRLEKRIGDELLKMQKNQREDYETFFSQFGLSIKYGMYEDFGANIESLQDLLLYPSSTGEMATLKEYVSRMADSQEYIYYAAGDSLEQLKELPAAEAVREKGYEILYLTDQVDEFVVRMMEQYEEKEFRSITGDDLGLETEEQKKEIEKKEEAHGDLLDFVKQALEGEVETVKLSTRLKTHPVVLASQGEITLEMERALSATPGGMPIRAERVLEINPEHPIFQVMTDLFQKGDKETVTLYSQLLYNQALVLEGMPIDDPVAFSQAITQLMID